ncbi:MAG: sporulation protein YtfJ [Clostridia bacterium]|nr:sporulation protein YtfJ [Clostridia bacterium]
MAKNNEKISSLISASAINLGDLADVNTIIGKPIVTASGFQIIPFSKITIGSLAGGGEYGDAKVVKELQDSPFAGGNGSVVTMKPMGFLIDDGKTCQLLRVTDDPMDNLVERAGEILRNITAKS